MWPIIGSAGGPGGNGSNDREWTRRISVHISPVAPAINKYMPQDAISKR